MIVRKFRRRKRREERAQKKLMEQQARLLQMSNIMKQKLNEENKKENNILPGIDVEIKNSEEEENKILDVENLTFDQIKEAFSFYDDKNIEDYNKPDFENDSLDILKEKLVTVIKQNPDPIKEKIKVIDNIEENLEDTIDRILTL